MTKKEFLEEIKKGTIDLPKEERENAIRYYEEYFLDAGDGKEDDVIKELGDPAKIVAQLKSSSSINSPSKKGMPVWLIVLLCIFGIPIGLPIILSLGIVVFALFICAWSLVFAFAIAAFACGIAGVGAFLVGLITLFQHVPTGILLMGMGMVSAGACLLFFIGVTALAKGVIKLITYLTHRRKGGAVNEI